MWFKIVIDISPNPTIYYLIWHDLLTSEALFWRNSIWLRYYWMRRVINERAPWWHSAFTLYIIAYINVRNVFLYIFIFRIMVILSRNRGREQQTNERRRKKLTPKSNIAPLRCAKTKFPYEIIYESETKEAKHTPRKKVNGFKKRHASLFCGAINLDFTYSWFLATLLTQSLKWRKFLWKLLPACVSVPHVNLCLNVCAFA